MLRSGTHWRSAHFHDKAIQFTKKHPTKQKHRNHQQHSPPKTFCSPPIWATSVVPLRVIQFFPTAQSCFQCLGATAAKATVTTFIILSQANFFILACLSLIFCKLSIYYTKVCVFFLYYSPTSFFPSSPLFSSF